MAASFEIRPMPWPCPTALVPCRSTVPVLPRAPCLSSRVERRAASLSQRPEKTEMSLQSKLFRGDPKLEAAATTPAAHIVPGAAGEHVAKIQQAVLALDGAGIDAGELGSQSYGPSTANAVLAYKKKRDIINRSYQNQADNIVGIMTMAALDKEMLQREQTTVVTVGTIRCELGRGTPGSRV